MYPPPLLTLACIFLLTEVQRGIDNIMWILAKQRLDSVTSSTSQQGPAMSRSPAAARKMEKEKIEAQDPTRTPGSNASGSRPRHHARDTPGSRALGVPTTRAMPRAQRYNSAARQAHQMIARETFSSSTRPVEASTSARENDHDKVDRGNPYRNPALDNRPDMLKEGMHSPKLLARSRASNLAQMNKLALSVSTDRGINTGINSGINHQKLHLSAYDYPTLDSAADDLFLLREIRSVVVLVVTVCNAVVVVVFRASQQQFA